MTASPLVRTRVRVLLSAAFVAGCWLLLAPGSAQADEASAPRPGLLGGVAASVGKNVSSPIATTTSTVAATVGRAAAGPAPRAAEKAAPRTPSPPAVGSATTHVTRAVDRVAAAAVDALPAPVGVLVDTLDPVTVSTVDTATGAVGSVLGAVGEVVLVVDEVVVGALPSVPGGVDSPVVTPPGDAVIGPPAAAAGGALSAVVGARIASLHVQRVEAAERARSSAPDTTDAGVVPVAVAALPWLHGAPGPLQPLPYLAVMAATGAVASFAGRGLGAGGHAVQPPRPAAPDFITDAVRAFLRGPALQPVLAPGTSPG